MNTKKKPDRIAQIVAEMSAITEFAEGSISSSSNYYPVKGGKRKKSAPHWKFQSLGPRGKRKYANVPAALVPRVKKLVENGKRYRKLESEYSRLVTEVSLDALKKRQTPSDPAAPAPRERPRTDRFDRARGCEDEAGDAAGLRQTPRGRRPPRPSSRGLP